MQYSYIIIIFITYLLYVIKNIEIIVNHHPFKSILSNPIANTSCNYRPVSFILFNILRNNSCNWSVSSDSHVVSVGGVWDDWIKEIMH